MQTCKLGKQIWEAMWKLEAEHSSTAFACISKICFPLNTLNFDNCTERCSAMKMVLQSYSCLGGFQVVVLQ